MSQFKYLGTTVTNQNLIQEEIKKRLNSGSACCHSVQNLLSAIEKRKRLEYNFDCGSVWVWNLVSEIKGGTQTEGVWQQGAEEDIWTKEGWGGRREEKTA
jgi:hypothetical protein